MTLTSWIILILFAAAGGVTQTLAGFGGAVVMMLVLPYLMPMVQAAAVASAACGALTAALVWRYRRNVRIGFVFLSAVPYLAASFLMLQFVKEIDARLIGLLFGIFLILLGLYYLVFSRRAHIPINPLTMLVCPVVSGLSSALFGIGGPLMSLVYLEKYKTREAYTANLQLLFFLAAIVNSVIRASKGIITSDLVPYLIAAVLAILVGENVGLQLAKRMKPDKLRKTVYVFVLLSGVLTVLKYL